MKKSIILIGAFVFSMLGFTNLTSAGTEFLNSDELKELFTGKTTPWKKLKNGQEGINIYHSDGTYSRVKNWKVTEDGYKCNYGGK